VDLIQSLIVLPLQEQSYKHINKSFRAFLDEFVKIEEEIGNPFYSLYVLKGIVDVARDVRADYYTKDYRSDAVKHFQNCVYDRVDKVAKYCRLKGVHFEKMLCGLLCLARNMEGVMYDVIYARMKKKHKQYAKLPLQTIEQMYAVLEFNIPDKYKFNENSTVMVMNCVDDTCSIMELTEDERDIVNETDSICRGTELYQLFQLKK
jgi:hypothetical protein